MKNASKTCQILSGDSKKFHQLIDFGGLYINRDKFYELKYNL